MGSLLPLSITTNCTMKSLLIFSTLLTVGLSEPEAKVLTVAPYNYAGIPGYYGGVSAPFAYNNAWTAQTAYPYAPQAAYSYAPYAQAYAPVAAPAPVAPGNYAAIAPAPLSSQFAAGDEFGNTQYGYSNWASSKHEVRNGFGQKPEVTNMLTPTVNSKPSLMSLMSSDSGPKIPDSQFITLNSQWLLFMNMSSPWLPFTNIPSLLLPFLMEPHPLLPKKLLRSLQLKLSI